MMKNVAVQLCAILCFLHISACRSQKQNITYDGQKREYTLYKPENLAENSPLVFVLHGYQEDSAETEAYFGMNQLAAEQGFAVVYPQGVEDLEGASHWNAQLSISTTNDIGFLVLLAQELQAQYGFDPNRTFSSGISNGGFMSYTLACNAPDTFKGIASVIGTMSGHTWNNCQPQEAIPVLQISGTNDEIVPIDGSMSTAGGWGGAPHIHDIVDHWASLNSCSSSTSFTPDTNTQATHHQECNNNHQVWYYQIDNLGHDIPSIDHGHAFDASHKIWEFFSNL